MDNEEEKSHAKRGLWKPEEDLILKTYVETYGEGNWADISRRSGLKRGGKSCRLRWKNYLRPNIKRGDMSQEEEDLIIRMHKLLGNRWSLIAGRLPGRTDNEVKNYWNTHLNKKRQLGKRKAVESDSNISSNHDNKKQSASVDFHPVHSSAREETNRELEEAKNVVNQESTPKGTWTEDIMSSFCYNIGSPLVLPDHATFVLDNAEPCFAFSDLFPLF